MPEILMPRLSDTMEEGVVSTWHKKPGEEVAEGESLVDIETDKALMEYEADTAGILETILVAEGESAPIGTPIAVIRAPGEAPSAAAPAASASAAPAAAAPVPAVLPDTPAAAATTGPTAVTAPVAAVAPAGAATNGRPPSSPLARRIARENDIDLAMLTGSGPGGRIVRADVEAAIAAAPATAAAPAAALAPAGPASAVAPAAAPVAVAVPADSEQVPLSRFRKVTARRLTESMQNVPHIYLTRVVDVDELTAFRASLNAKLDAAGRPKVSLNDLVVRACAAALRLHPYINASFTEDHLLLHKRIHIGIAVALEDGLVVPVIRDADTKTVTEISKETRELAGRAREQKLKPQEMTGGTFTVSNLGMFGVDQFTAVINPPEAAILAVGATRQEVTVKDGEIVPARRMTVTLSVDHRAADGATGAKFLATLAELLEDPIRILA
jgi:pyruvate dehydrogenase E2 component (dihydrolipoamide acetyltransferase)